MTCCKLALKQYTKIAQVNATAIKRYYATQINVNY